MPRFYFDIQDRDGYHRDDVGDEFRDVFEAQDQVHALLPDIARWQTLDGTDETIVCCMRDDGGEVVYRGELIFRGTTVDVEPSRTRSGAAPSG